MEGIVIKEKYLKTKFVARLLGVNNVGDCIYTSVASDKTNKKLTKEQLEVCKEEKLKLNYHLQIVVTDGIESIQLSLFERAVYKLLDEVIPAEDFDAYSETEKKIIIDNCIDCEYEIFVQSKVSKSGRSKRLIPIVKKINLIRDDDDDNKRNDANVDGEYANYCDGIDDNNDNNDNNDNKRKNTVNDKNIDNTLNEENEERKENDENIEDKDKNKFENDSVEKEETKENDENNNNNANKNK